MSRSRPFRPARGLAVLVVALAALTGCSGGEEAGSATSDEEGNWEIVVPAGGTYEVSLEGEAAADLGKWDRASLER